MLKETARKETKALNNMLILSVITIAFHAYLTHKGLSPFQLLEADEIYQAELTVANNGVDKLSTSGEVSHCVVSIPSSMADKNYC